MPEFNFCQLIISQGVPVCLPLKVSSLPFSLIAHTQAGTENSVHGTAGVHLKHLLPTVDVETVTLHSGGFLQPQILKARYGWLG